MALLEVKNIYKSFGGVKAIQNFSIEANAGEIHGIIGPNGAPQVAYRETIRKEANQETKYARQSGGKGQYGHVKIKLEPNPGKGYEFVNGVVGGANGYTMLSLDLNR